MTLKNKDKNEIKLTLSFFHDDSGFGLEYTVEPINFRALEIYAERFKNISKLENTRLVKLDSCYKLYISDNHISPEDIINLAVESADNFRAIYAYPVNKPEQFDLTIYYGSCRIKKYE